MATDLQEPLEYEPPEEHTVSVGRDGISIEKRRQTARHQVITVAMGVLLVATAALALDGTLVAALIGAFGGMAVGMGSIHYAMLRPEGGLLGALKGEDAVGEEVA